MIQKCPLNLAEQSIDINRASLPGPDTSTKREALAYTDIRFLLMLEEAMRIGWPEAFEDDLYLHDRRTLGTHPELPMLWILRDHGTHLYPSRCDTRGEVAYYRRVIEYWSGDHRLNHVTKEADRARYYLVTPDGLRPLTWQEACDSLTVKEDHA